MAGFCRTQRGDVLVPPGVGEHGTQILDEAGLSEQAIRNLIDQGVVRAVDPGSGALPMSSAGLPPEEDR